MKKFLSSKLFFVLIIGFFVFEAGWIAVSARYPMAFDEAYHLGIIKIYSHQLSPLLHHQPDGAAPFGPLTVASSYLYHYLMSFPYRWLSATLDDPKSVIVALRFINIALMGSALVLYRRVLGKTKASAAAANLTMLVFVLIPIVPLLAGQLNYDNLLILLLAISTLLVLDFQKQLKGKKQVNTGLFMHIFSVAMLACLVKFVYLPFFLAIVLFLGWILYRNLGSPKKIWRSAAKNWHSLTRVNRGIALAVLIISLGLFMQRYGQNVIRYHNVDPSCDQVLALERCEAYGPWARNHNYMAHAKDIGLGNPAVFTGSWLVGMFDRSFFVINGPGGRYTYQNHIPLPLMSITVILVFLFGLYLIWRYRRQLLQGDPALQFMLLSSFIYLGALVYRNYTNYLQFGGQLAAINGRYLLMMIMPVLLLLAMAYQRYLKPRQALPVAAVILLLLLQGGGFISFIYYSHPGWYWPNDRTSVRINNDAQKIVKPFIVNWPKDSWR